MRANGRALAAAWSGWICAQTGCRRGRAEVRAWAARSSVHTYRRVGRTSPWGADGRRVEVRNRPRTRYAGIETSDAIWSTDGAVHDGLAPSRCRPLLGFRHVVGMINVPRILDADGRVTNAGGIGRRYLTATHCRGDPALMFHRYFRGAARYIVV